MNFFFFVRNGELLAGKIDSSNSNLKKSTIIGAPVIEGLNLRLTTNKHTVILPYVYVHLDDALAHLKMWANRKKDILLYLSKNKIGILSHLDFYQVRFAVIDSKLLPVIKIDIKDQDVLCFALNSKDELIQINIKENNLYDDYHSAASVLKNSLEH